MNKKNLFAITLFFSLITGANALVINEIMSNPVGDDSGREWIELYNETNDPVDVASLTISIKGGNAVTVTPLSGGTVIPPLGYGIIGSVVSGGTKFSQDYPLYNGPLFRSSISLVNSGITSIDIRLGGIIVNAITSYTAAKEGLTYSLFQGSYKTGSPTPGAENGVLESSSVGESEATSTTASNQVTIPQMSPPSADIIFYLPGEKIVVAGAPSLFSVYTQNGSGKAIENITYTWAFGDGGQKMGSSTLYRYYYPGRYTVQVEGSNGRVAGTGRMVVRVVAPEITLSSIESGKYGPYISLFNPNAYDLEISDWKLSIDGAIFSFPKNTLLGRGETKFPGITMGFASTTIATSSIIKLLFSNGDEVVRIYQQKDLSVPYVVEKIETVTEKTIIKNKKAGFVRGVTTNSTSTKVKNGQVDASTTKKVLTLKQQEKDTRIAAFIRSFFSK